MDLGSFRMSGVDLRRIYKTALIRSLIWVTKSTNCWGKRDEPLAGRLETEGFGCRK